MAMMMLNGRNVMGNAAATVRRLVRQAREDVSSMLLVVGFVTCLTLVLAASSRFLPPAESPLVASNQIYLGAFLGAFVGGLATMWAAVWVAGDAARRRATGRLILGGSMVWMVVAFGLDQLSSATTPAASTSLAL